MSLASPEPPTADAVRAQLHVLRGHRVLLDADLARLYGVPRRRLLALAQRFPGDFCFPLEDSEFFGASMAAPPQVFTEHGALAAAFALKTARAIEAATCIVRVCVQLRLVREKRE